MALGGINSGNAGESSCVALKSDGSVYAWGHNDYGQLGISTNDTNAHSTPVQVHGVGNTGYLSGIMALAPTGAWSTLAVKNDGTVYAWGYGGYGALGDSTTTDRYVPVQVKGVGGTGSLATVVQVATRTHSVAITANGSVYAWGDNTYGQLGNSSTAQSLVPVQVKGAGATGTFTAAVNVCAGDYNTFLLKNDGTAYACGYNSEGEVGDGTTTQRTAPVQVNGGSGMTTFAAGDEASCAIKNTGDVYAWGANVSGELGDSTTTNRSSPVQVKGMGGTGSLANIGAATVGGYWDSSGGKSCNFMLAATNDGTVYAWGYNGKGQLGDSTTTKRTTPVQVSYNFPAWVSPPGGTCTLGATSDQSYTVTLQGKTLSSVKNGATTLAAGTHYTWDAGTGALVILASYLNTLPTGSNTITLTMDDASTAVIGILARAGNASVNPTSNSCVIGQSTNQAYTVTLNGNTLSGGVTNTTTGDTLTLNTDYTWSSPTLTLKANYLNNINTHKLTSNGLNTITLNMSGGTNPTISLIALTTPVSFITTFTHGAASDKTYDIYGPTFSSVKNGGTTLAQTTHYTYSSNVLTLNATYLNTLAAGSYTIGVYFTGPQAGEGEIVYIFIGVK